MSTRALVTGRADETGSVADALRDDGFEVALCEDLDKLPALVAELGASSLDCYVQMPVEIHPRGESVVGLVHDFLAQGLLARFSALEQVLPAVRDGGGVLLVTGNHPEGVDTPDDHGARLGLLKVLAHAVLADRHDTRSWVRIADRRQVSDDVVGIVKARGAEGSRLLFGGSAGAEPQLDYAAWRQELFAMAGGEA